MPKFLGNKVGFAVSTYSDGGIFNTSQQFYLKNKEKWPPFVEASSESTTGDDPPILEPGNGYKYHVFKSPGTFTVTTGGKIYYTVIGGGGGGGRGGSSYSTRGGGGGGAGAYKAGILHAEANTYPVDVGAGGVGGSRDPGTSEEWIWAANGEDSKISNPTTSIVIAIGGGYGGVNPYYPSNSNHEGRTANPGGCGGGGRGFAGYSEVNYNTGGTASLSSSPTEILRGYPGGDGVNGSGGGGGGIGGAGDDGYYNEGTAALSETFPRYNEYFGSGNGGIGRAFGVINEDYDSLPSDYGSPGNSNVRRFFGGGGGGGARRAPQPTSFPINPNGGIGIHGGGDGGNGVEGPPQGDPGDHGIANTGGGGGAGSGGYTPNYSETADNYGGNGGSGIVIISYSTGS